MTELIEYLILGMIDIIFYYFLIRKNSRYLALMNEKVKKYNIISSYMFILIMTAIIIYNALNFDHINQDLAIISLIVLFISLIVMYILTLYYEHKMKKMIQKQAKMYVEMINKNLNNIIK